MIHQIGIRYNNMADANKAITELEAENARLEVSRNLCHVYGKCTPDNCNLDGDSCPVAAWRTHSG